MYQYEKELRLQMDLTGWLSSRLLWILGVDPLRSQRSFSEEERNEGHHHCGFSRGHDQAMQTLETVKEEEEAVLWSLQEENLVQYLLLAPRDPGQALDS